MTLPFDPRKGSLLQCVGTHYAFNVTERRNHKINAYEKSYFVFLRKTYKYLYLREGGTNIELRIEVGWASYYRLIPFSIPGEKSPHGILIMDDNTASSKAEIIGLPNKKCSFDWSAGELVLE